MDFKLNGGVLIIGSLLWDNSEIRKEWRNKNLRPLQEGITVKAPIRYGRISKSRNCTYSMVFSNECVESSKLGIAKFLGFLNNPVSFDEFWIHCNALIQAERNKAESFATFNWSWGALGLCINPKTEIHNPKKVELLKENWKTKYSSLIPSDFQVDSEGLIISGEGILNVQWMEELDKYDFFITTLTKPEKKYPSSYKIAERMIINKDESYFNTTQEYGIKTFQDNEIKLELKVINNFKESNKR